MKYLGALFACVFVLAAVPAASAQVYSPLTLTGYNVDGIANGTYSNAASVTGSVTTTGLDGSTSGEVLYQVGFNPNHSAYGVNAGATFTSKLNANVTFAVQPAAGNNLLFVQGGGANSGTLTLGTPGAYTNLAFLVQGYNVGASSGGVSGTYQLNYTNGTNSGALTFAAYDWFSTSNVASAPLDRVSSSGTFDNSTSNPVFHEVDVTVPGNLAIASITFVNKDTTANDNLGVFGISGAVPEPAAWAALLAVAACLLGVVRRFRSLRPA